MINGVGSSKLRDFGGAFVEVISAYRAAKEKAACG
jgi:hypothetical protein